VTRDHAEPAPAPLTPAVVRFGRLGDMVILTALLQELHARYGRACLVLAAGPWNAPLLGSHPDVGCLYDLPRHSPLLLRAVGWQALAALRRAAPGPVYVCEYQPRQVPRIRRFLRLGGIDPARCLFIGDQPAAPDEPWIERLVRFGERTPAAVAAAAYPVPAAGAPWAPRLYTDAADAADVAGWLRERGLSGHPLVLIQAGNFRTMSRHRERYQAGSGDDKAWPAAHWTALIAQILGVDPQVRVVLCGAPQESALLEELAHHSGRPEVRAAALPLRRLLALCAVADSMISIDTGPAHAAAACGLPLLVLYGAENPRQWLPRSATGSTVRALGGPPRVQRVDQLTVAEVFGAWRTLPARSRLHGAA